MLGLLTFLEFNMTIKRGLTQEDESTSWVHPRHLKANQKKKEIYPCGVG